MILFYDYVKNHALSTALLVLAPSTDHSTYITSTPLDSFKNFCVSVEEDRFCLFDFLKNVRVTNVDPERLFLLARLTKIFSSVQLVSRQPPPKRILEEKHGFSESVNGAMMF